MKKVDELMINYYNISLEQMMENAGIRLAELARKISKGKNIAVFCGPGNNGGGGLVAARHLHNYGKNVLVVLSNKEIKKIPRKQLRILKKLDLKVIHYDEKTNKKINNFLGETDLVIDALLGYNLKGNPRGKIEELVKMINDSGKKILSLDVPTGLDATTGKVYEPCVKSDFTLTLALPKTGLKKIRNLFLANISVPDELYRKMRIKVSKDIFKEKDILKIQKL